jgi:hypothetical protein
MLMRTGIIKYPALFLPAFLTGLPGIRLMFQKTKSLGSVAPGNLS